MKIPDHSKKSIRSFLDALGASTPAPGGGSAAALTGAMGVALLEMLMGLNLKRALKKKGLAPSKIAERILRRTAPATRIRRELTRILTGDIVSFSRLTALYARPGSKSKLPAALKRCALSPMRICELSLTALRMTALERPLTSAWLKSDLHEAAILLRAAIAAARLNVEINTGSKDLNDKTFVRRTAQALDRIDREASRLSREISAEEAR